MAVRNCVYILLCNNGRFYVGSTKELGRRVEQHRSGRVRATKGLRPVRLVFSQSYPTIREARQIEQWLKRQKSRELLEQIIEEGEIKKQVS